MNYQHLLEALTKAYLDPKFIKVYAGRWDVWLIQHGQTEEWKALFTKTDDQLKYILEHARNRAESIKKSPLSRALEMIL